MHVLFYSNWYLKQTVQLANALATEHRVTLIFPEVSPELNAYSGRVAGLKEILAPGITLITLPYMQELSPLGWIPVLKARSLIHKLRPDVVHFNESYDFRCLCLMRFCPGVPFITSVHDPLPHSDEKISLQKFKHWVRDQIRRRSAGLVVFGETLREVLANYSQIPVERIYAVPHGEYRYYELFDNNTSTHQGNAHKKVLFFGRWERYKGIDVLIEAEPLISARVPNARIVLAGEGRLSLSELQGGMLHPDHFEIRNYAIPDAEVPELFREADVVVLPYREATQSGPLHIAGTFARPVVVSRVGAMPEIVQDGETGLLVSPGDPQELAEAVCRLLENPDEACRLAENAHARMQDAESMERVAQVQSEVYHGVVASFQRQMQRKSGFTLLQRFVKLVKHDPNYTLDEALGWRDLAGMFWKLGASLIRGFWQRLFLAEARGLLFIGKNVRLRNCKHITLGKNFIAEDGCEIQGLSKSGVIFGDNFTIGSYAMIRPSGYYGREIGAGLKIGDRSNVGPYCYLGASGGITIGNDVMMGPRVSFFAENHNFERTDVAMRQQGCTRKPIVIEDNCWIASGAIILAGVTVGRGSIIGAGAVVNRNVPPYSIVAGNPARVIRTRSETPAQQEVEP
ncbi:MAG: glycosyltransferase [bacterium]